MKRRRNPEPDQRARDLFVEFHQFEPEKIGSFHRSFKIPKHAYHVGEAKKMFYASDKLNPETSEDEGWIHYVHDHEGGVGFYLPGRNSGGDYVDVPDWVCDIDTLVRIGDCEGYEFEDLDGDTIEAKGTKPLPEWYAIPSGRALFVVQSKRRVLALLWGGDLDVEWRGVVG
jgi:hypothetical protein